MKYLESIHLFVLNMYMSESLLHFANFENVGDCALTSINLLSIKEISLIQCLDECLKKDFCRVVAYNKNTTECIMDTSGLNRYTVTATKSSATCYTIGKYT